MKDKKNIGIPVKVNFGKSNNPLQQHVEEENKSKGWVKWGKKNDIPQWYLKLYYNNALHGGLINSKVDYIVSGGYTIQADSDADRIKAETFLETQAGEFAFKDVYRQNAFDLCMFNAFDIRIVFTNMGGQVKFFEPVDSDLIRQNLNGNHYYYSRDWSTDNQTSEKTGYKTYRPYDKDNRTGECLLHYQVASRSYDHKKDLGVYPKPYYSGGIRAICTDSNIDDFNYYELVNGFKNGTYINLANGVPETEDERNRIADEIRDGATDMDNSGGIVVGFSDGKETAPEILNLTGNNLPDRYKQSEISTQQKILTSHSVTTPGLHGIKTAGQLGGQQELEAGFEIFKKTFVSSRHEIMQAVYNELLNIAGINAEIILNEPRPLFVSSEADEEGSGVLEALNSMSPLVATKVLDSMTENEIRRLAALNPVEGGDEIKSDVAFSFKDPVSILFTACGVDAQKVKRIAQIELNDFDSVILDSLALDAKKTERFKISGLSDWEEDVLAQLLDDVDPSDIEGDGNINEALKKLRDKGYVDSSNKVTEVARELANVSFDILYEYVERADAPPLKGESRDFCQEMVRMNRLFTREEIDRISASVGRDVWRYRGGWYHNPNTDRNTPSCRHTWRQVLVQN